MLRNLNQRLTNGRICGTPKTGVLGALVPRIGRDGGGFLAASLTSSEDSVEVSGYIESLPPVGVITADETTAFTYTGPNTTMTMRYRRAQVDQGTAVITLNATSNITISGIVGNSVASGVTSTVSSSASSIIHAIVGNSVASGVQATISNNSAVTVSGIVGNAVAAGVLATISNTKAPKTGTLNSYATIGLSNSLQQVYICQSGKESIVIGCNIANTINTAISVDVKIRKSGVDAYLLKGMFIPPNTAYVSSGADQKIVLNDGDSIQMQSSSPTSADVLISASEFSTTV